MGTFIKVGLGLSFLVGIYLVFSYTFLRAYISPDKTVTIDINAIGEASFELLLLVFMVPFVLLTTIWTVIKAIG